MPRPRSSSLRADWKISLPAALCAEVELILQDPVSKKTKYGARSELIERLLRNWLAEQYGEAPQPVTVEDLLETH